MEITKWAARKRVARFRLPMARDRIVIAVMKRQMIRVLLATFVVAVTFLAAKIWSAKYDTESDPKARFEIQGVQVSSDRKYRWVEIHLQKNGEGDHDLRKPVRLITRVDARHEPVDTTFAGSREDGFTEIWLKFWLTESDLKEPLTLKINDGELRVKTNRGHPFLGSDGKTVFKSSDWEKSWLGF